MERLTTSTRTSPNPEIHPMRAVPTLLIASILLAGGPLVGQDIFTDMTVAAGIDAAHHATFLVTGQAWGDYDRDGLLDLYMTDSAGPNVLYRGNAGGVFSVSPHNSQVSIPADESGGATFADYDNDGWLDLYVLNKGANRLFRNDGGQGFVDVTTQSGLGEPGQGESAAWGDYDGDGHLDLYVVNWYFGDDETSPHNRDSLFHNEGDGTFTDASTLLLDGRMRGPGFAVTFFDFDNDRDLDIYVLNDKHWGNLLWRNDGDGCGGWCFTDVSVSAGAHRPAWSMGIASGDYDNDGDLDLYYSSIGEQVLLQNQTSQGSPTFIEVSEAAGVNFAAIGWGSVFFDYDHDGWLDLYLSSMNAGNRLYRNLGDGTFDDVSDVSGASDLGPSIGVASGDYDADGRVDLIIGNYNDGYVLYRNESVADGSNHWLTVRLEGRHPVPRSPMGARVTVETTDGRTLMQEVSCDSSLGSGNDLALNFGLGSAFVDTLSIVWPDGATEVLTSVGVDQEIRRVYPFVFADGFESGDLSSWGQ